MSSLDQEFAKKMAELGIKFCVCTFCIYVNISGLSSGIKVTRRFIFWLINFQSQFHMLTLCLLGNLHAFLSSAVFVFFTKNCDGNTIRMENSLDPDQARRFDRIQARSESKLFANIINR